MPDYVSAIRETRFGLVLRPGIVVEQNYTTATAMLSRQRSEAMERLRIFSGLQPTACCCSLRTYFVNSSALDLHFRLMRL